MVDVEGIQVGSRIVMAGSPMETFVSATGSQSETAQMYVNGQVQYALDSSYFPDTATQSADTNTDTSSSNSTNTSSGSSSGQTLPTASGGEALAVVLSEDAWQGDANAVVAVDGTTVFNGAVTVANGGAGETVALGTYASTAPHSVSVSFTNDAYGGTASTDRNLYVQSVLVNGASVGGAASLYSASTATTTVPANASTTALPITLGSGSDSVTLGISEDAWQGDAQYIVTLNGTQVGGVQTATEAHGSGSQQVTLQGDFSHGAQTVGVQFLNDAYGGTASTDRNLYIDSVSLNGSPAANGAALYSNGTASFTVGTGSAAASAAATVAPSIPAATPSGASYYVSTGGSDGNDGSAAHPFATVQHAADVMAGSGIKTTIIQGGTYNQIVSLGSSDSGESFTAAANQTVTLAASGAASLFTLNGASHVTVSGLSLTGSSGPAVSVLNGTADTITDDSFTNDWGGVMIGAGTDHIAVTNSKMTNTSFAGVELKDGTSNDTVDSNVINGIGPVASNTYGGAIYAHGSSSSQFTHNTISNTNGAGINLSDFYTSGTGTENLNDTIAYNALTNTDLTSGDSGSIYILGRSLAETGTTVKMNFIDGTGDPSQHSVGIYLDDNASGVAITGNIVRDVGSDAVQIHGGSNDTVSGNILDLGTGHPSAVLFQANPSDQPNPSPSQNNSVIGNIIETASSSPGAFFVNLNGGSPTVSGNDYVGLPGVGLNTSPDTSAHYQNPGFANASAGNYAFSGGAGIGFASIDQSAIGVQPAGPHAY